MKKVAWIAVVLWMAFIFYMSHQPAHVSNELSKEVAKVIAVNFDMVANEEFQLGSFNGMIRKYAHFFLYLVLGLVVIFSLNKTGMRGTKAVLLSIAICVVFAITDEWHQLFVPGRGAQISDVLIDSCGAIVGVMSYVGIKLMVRKAIWA
ncbi:VanZ family protein [Ureibacillus acetophenoni]|uniref:VanZ family protein n=1 Tax=Ureibacillus acetophenoni TaxID=614649 RepID=A0A285UDW1_9BACL|nr:VanZ family protein [Ureibacillus acetophenoni]SOC38481.1 VanZ family protein [Ureibacillus acetophenoni]